MSVVRKSEITPRCSNSFSREKEVFLPREKTAPSGSPTFWIDKHPHLTSSPSPKKVVADPCLPGSATMFKK